MALADEDKQWLTQHFATKAHVERFATREDLEAVETKLLSAFHSWASPVEARQRGQRDILYALDLQVSSLAERVNRLESGSAAK